MAAQAAAKTVDTAKESEKLQKKADEARTSVDKTRQELESAMELYNSIVGGKNPDARGSHKKLAKIVDGVIAKNTANAGKWDQMKATSAQFIKGWETALASYSDETMKAAGQTRLDAAKERYGKLSDALATARETYGQFRTSLKDQVTFMGRDLSPDALASLQEPAAKLNDQYNTLKAKAEELKGVMDQNRVA